MITDNNDNVIKVNRPEEIDALISAVTSMLKSTLYPMEDKRVGFYGTQTVQKEAGI